MRRDGSLLNDNTLLRSPSSSKLFQLFQKSFAVFFMSDSKNDNLMFDDAIIGAEVTASKAVKRRDEAG